MPAKEIGLRSFWQLSEVQKEITNDSCLAKPPENLPYRDIGGRGRGRVREGGPKQLNADSCWIASMFLLAYRQRYTRSRSDSWSSNHFSAQSSISRSSPSSGPPDSPNRTTGSSAGNRLHHGGGSSNCKAQRGRKATSYVVGGIRKATNVSLHNV